MATNRKPLVYALSLLGAAILITWSWEGRDSLAAPPSKLAPGNWIVFAQVVGAIQGPIEGSSERPSREGFVEAFGFGHEVRVPHDPGTGLPSGPRVHSPFKMVKLFDKATPGLYQALTTDEIVQVTIQWYRVDDAGSEQHYFTAELSDAHIVRIAPMMPTAQDPSLDPDSTDSYRHLEEVQFTYGTIKWTWEPDALEFTDTWN